MKYKCPACGSDNIERSEKKEFMSKPYSDGEIIIIINYKCNDCLMEGDFFNENEIIINKALIRQGKNAATNILDYFIINAICFSAVERIIGLPQGSIKQWSEKEILSPAEMAILRLVRAFPDLLEKIDNKINKKESI